MRPVGSIRAVWVIIIGNKIELVFLGYKNEENVDVNGVSETGYKFSQKIHGLAAFYCNHDYRLAFIFTNDVSRTICQRGNGRKC